MKRAWCAAVFVTVWSLAGPTTGSAQDPPVRFEVPFGLTMAEFLGRQPGATCGETYCEIASPRPEQCPGERACVQLIYSFNGGRLRYADATLQQADWQELRRAATARYGEPETKVIPAKYPSRLRHEMYSWHLHDRVLLFNAFFGVNALGQPVQRPFSVSLEIATMRPGSGQ